MTPIHPSETMPGSDKVVFSIRKLKTFEEFQLAEAIQRDVWGITDNSEIVPKDLLLIVQKSGGLVLGAFNPAGEMLGMLFGFLGRTPDGHWKHCSHMMGVLRDYRSAGIGEALKAFQREIVLSQGLDLITWTVNPLEGVNASLNFGKLGVVCRHYFPNAYGVMTDALNLGLPSDRFEVEWWIGSPRVEQRLLGMSGRPRLADVQRRGAQFVNSTISKNGFRLPGEIDLAMSAPILLVEVPSDFQKIKAFSIDIALDWIKQTREIFETYFEKGFVVSEFISETGTSERRNYFVLQPDLTKILNP